VVELQRLVIRARQIKALYQREITALHRDPAYDVAARRTHAAHLWRQTTEQLAALQARAEGIAGSLTDDQQALFAAPTRPAELADPERESAER
jgi:hypothetical protein